MPHEELHRRPQTRGRSLQDPWRRDNQYFAYDEDKKPRCDDIVSSPEVMNREHRGCNNQRNSVKAPKESTH
jgi:hypothetical protein